MNILLTGYSGNLGRAVAKLMLQNGHKLRVLLHGSILEGDTLDPAIEIIWGSLSQTDLMDKLTKGIDIVIHCAWERRGGDTDQMKLVNYNGTLLLINAANRNGVKTFIHISSVGVYGLKRELWQTVIDESQELVSQADSMDPYPWVKVIIENKCKEISPKLGMNLVIIRPGLLFSDSKAPAKKLINRKRNNFGLIIGRGKNHLPYIHVKDVSQLILEVINRPRKFAIYNCVPTCHISAKIFLKNWSRYQQLSVKVICLPPFFLRMARWGIRKLKKILGKEMAISNVDYQMLTGLRDIRYSVYLANRDYGWQDKITQEIAGMRQV